MTFAGTVAATGRIQAGIARAASWWLAQWRACLPDALRTASTASRPVRLTIQDLGYQVTLTLIDPDGAEIFSEAHSWSDYTKQTLDRCLTRAKDHVGHGRIAVSLVAASAIHGYLPIPLQARTQADTIVRDHVARRTPLALDHVFVGHDLRPSVEGKLDLDYLVLPKAHLAHQLDRLGLQLHEIGTLEGPSIGGKAPVTVPLNLRKEGFSLSVKIAGALVLSSVTASTAAFCVQVWRQAEILDGIEARLAREIPPAHQSAGRLQSVFGMAEDIARMADMRSTPGVVQVWEELSRVIPVSTYLTEFEVQETEVLATGYSDAAPELVRILEESPILHGAAFTGSVVQDRAKGKEQFALRALLRKPRLPTEEGK